MPIVVRDPTSDEKEEIMKGVEDGKVTLSSKGGKEYMIGYSVSTESRVTSSSSFKKRVEKVTCGSPGDVIYFEVLTEVTGENGEKAELPKPLCVNPPPKKNCTFFNKGTCKNGVTCQFAHLYEKPRVPRSKN